jgi:hypothetical protein
MKAFALRRGGKRVWESLWSLGFYSLPNFLNPFQLRTIINFGPVPPLKSYMGYSPKTWTIQALIKNSSKLLLRPGI